MLICLVRVVALCYNLICSQTLSLNFSLLNNTLGSYIKKKVQEKFYLTKILKEMQLAILIMRLSCNNFKIRKFVERNCKILCVCMCVCVFFFCQYIKLSFYQIFYNLNFLMTTPKKFPKPPLNALMHIASPSCL